MQRRRQQNGPRDRVLEPVLQHQLGPERPADQPRVRQSALCDERHRGGDVVPFSDSAVEGTLRRTPRRRGAAGVEAQHREGGEGGQPSGCLSQDVRIHETAMGRQRVQKDKSRDRRPVERHREFADQRQAIGRGERNVFSPRGQLDTAGDLDRVGHVRIFQHRVCQCRRPAKSSASPMSPSARHATRCAVPGTISRPHPGQV